jgi:hypothetical protein
MSWISDRLYGAGLALGKFRAGMQDSLAKGQLKPTKAPQLPQVDAAGPPKGGLVDPNHSYWDPSGFRERPTRLTYETLRMISYRVPIINAIIFTRTNQVAAHGRLPENDYDIGFRVRPRRFRGSRRDVRPTKAEQGRIDEMEDFILRCTRVRGQDGALVNDTFPYFLRKIIRDSLTYDQINFQIVPTLKGEPHELIAMPAHSMRLLQEDDLYSDLRTNMYEDGWTIQTRGPDEEAYCQVYQKVPVAKFTPREMSWGVRNPRSDIDVGGYGLSEIETIVHIMTAIIHAETYNTRFFSQGTAVKGILNFKGPVPERQLHEFRREWHALLTGVHNAFRTPVTNAEDLQWISMHETNRDMEFSEWLNYLIKVATSIYQISPMELNFQFGNTGQDSALNQGSQEWKIRESRARGLRPLLAIVAELLTKHVIWAFDGGEDFELIFVGLDADSEMDRISKAEQYSKTIMTIDEARDRLFEMEPLPDGKGGIIRDPYYMQSSQIIDSQKGEEGGEEEEGPQFDFGEDSPDEGGSVFSEEEFQEALLQGTEEPEGEEPEGEGEEPEPVEKSLTFSVEV